METTRLTFIVLAVLLIIYTIYLTSQSNFSESQYQPHRATQSNLLQSCNLLPFCADRASLLSALGSRTGCTYKWFPPIEICMILERFGALVFVGDDYAGDVYAGFNMLLSEGQGLTQKTRDMRHGGPRESWDEDCACSEQMFSKECLDNTFRDFDVLGQDFQAMPQQLLCNRIPHTYLAVSTTPSPSTTISSFKSLTYSKPRHWQPSPLIFSFSHGSSLSIPPIAKALDEWQSLAAGAERNIPMLFLSLRVIGPEKEVGGAREFGREIVEVAKERHFEVLSLYNSTRTVGNGRGGDKIDIRTAMVEAMIVINWLSKLESS